MTLIQCFILLKWFYVSRLCWSCDLALINNFTVCSFISRIDLNLRTSKNRQALDNCSILVWNCSQVSFDNSIVSNLTHCLLLMYLSRSSLTQLYWWWQIKELKYILVSFVVKSINYRHFIFEYIFSWNFLFHSYKFSKTIQINCT